jgi:ubiquinone/menaquinone biosynthesis C-methylase UbiE
VTERRDFDKDAAKWDEDPRRVQQAHTIADAMIAAVKPTREMDALDFGCGTGLVTLRLQPLVRAITGVDSSREMLRVLGDKVRSLGLPNVRTELADVERGDRVAGRFDLIVSSMTLHHIRDTSALFRHWLECLAPGGAIAVADLDREDGTFHGDHTGVFHHGFDRGALVRELGDAGFSDASVATATTVTRERDGVSRTYSVLLATARRPPS